MPRKCQEEAQLIRDFAAAHGIALRTARNFRCDPKTKSPRQEWVDWLRSKGRLARAPGGSPTNEPPATVPMNELEKSRVARDRAFENLQELQNAAVRARQAGDDSRIALMTRAVRDAQKCWEQASAYADKMAERAGVMVPVENVRAVQRQMVEPLGAIVRGLKEQIAAHLPPAARPAYYRAFSAVIPQFNAQLAALDKTLERLLIC